MNYFFENVGFCPICEKDVLFSSENAWFRDFLLCSSCGSIPRERALIKVLKDYYPNYKNLYIHESSPAKRGASSKLKLECTNYSSSQLFKNIPCGDLDPKTGYRCENLEQLTFLDDTFDVFITQDVMEHVFDYKKAFKEIARVLKKGGAHIFSVPLINKTEETEIWASKDQLGNIIYHHEPEYHGNPIDSSGSLVTVHWGYDISKIIYDVAGTPTTILIVDDLNCGIRAEYIDILISKK